MRFRSLDYGDSVPAKEMGAAAIDDLLERGDLDAWAPLAREILDDPHCQLADTVLSLCNSHSMYGTSQIWRTWIERLRQQPAPRQTASLAEARRRSKLTQHEVARRMGISQSDVSKLERRNDLRMSTLRAYLEALGATLVVSAAFPDEEMNLEIETRI